MTKMKIPFVLTNKLLLLLSLVLPPIVSSMSLPYATCDDCFCVPENGDPCPVGRMPETNFTELLPLLESINHTNPFKLDKDCNVHEDSACATDPPQELRGQDGAVCAYRYVYDDSVEGTCPISYSHESVVSKEAAEAEGLVVTHYGACGVCSSAQDLSVYLAISDLSSAGINCGLKYLAEGLDAAIACYQEIGFSLPCATLWTFDLANTQKLCLQPCLKKNSENIPNNGDPPMCALDDCLQCNEDTSGEVFAGVGGRTRRNSGLLSMIARPCSQLLEVDHPDPCLLTSQPSVSPTSQPSASPPSSGSRISKNLSLIGMMIFTFFSLGK